MIRSSVVFTQPDGPRNVTRLPRGTSSETSSSAVKRPKRLVMPVSDRKVTGGAPARSTLCIRFPRLSFLALFRQRLAVVALRPLGEDLVAILRRPVEIVLDEPLLVVGGNELERLRHP